MAGAVAAIVWAVVPGQETIAPFAYHREREGEFQRAGAAGVGAWRGARPAGRGLPRQTAAARRRHDAAAVARLSRQRRRVDQRFDPARSLTAMGRYLALARPKFAGRPDFAVVSYHMG